MHDLILEKIPLLNEICNSISTSVGETLEVKRIAQELEGTPRLLAIPVASVGGYRGKNTLVAEATCSHGAISELELAVHDITSQVPVYEGCPEPEVPLRSEPLNREPSARLEAPVFYDLKPIASSIGTEKEKIKGSIQTMYV